MANAIKDEAGSAFTYMGAYLSYTTDISCSFLLPSANMRRSSIPNICICQLYLVPEPESKIVNGTQGYLRLTKGKIKHCRAQTINNHQSLKAKGCDRTPAFSQNIDRTLS
ncbi:hypothetical protein NC652_001687 [Populus alba x Populus x berolinensis]|nr:hypothetical protein NC652_001687 [Populus alba x Populus x berolinensis]